MKYFQLSKSISSYVVLFFIWAVTWKIVSNPLLIPSPIDVFTALYTYIFEEKFQIALTNTLTNLLIAWTIIQVCLFVTLGLQFNNLIKKLLTDWATLFQPLPTFALLPVLIVILGLNNTTLFVLIISSNLWAGVSYLLSSADLEQKKWGHHAKNFNWGISQQLTHIYVYALLPHALSISAITWGLTWRTLLAVEVTMGGIGDSQGLGIIMTEDRMIYDIAEIWAVLLVILVISAVVQQIFEKIKAKVHW